MKTAKPADKGAPPDEAALRAELGRSFERWNELRDGIVERHDRVKPVWKPGTKGRWYLKLEGKKRAVLFMAPDAGRISVSMLFGEKAIEAVRRSNLPKDVIDLIVNGKQYPEGRLAPFHVKTKADVRLVEQVAAVKEGI